MKYKPGDKVRIKSIDWYNSNKDEVGAIYGDSDAIFIQMMSKFCGQTVTISEVAADVYGVLEDNDEYSWADYMIEELVLEKGSELPSVTYIPYIIEESPPLETSTEMCPKIEVPTRYYGEIKYEPKMVSLDKVCDLLYAMLTTQDINDYNYVTAPAYDNVVDFVEDFRKSFKE